MEYLMIAALALSIVLALLLVVSLFRRHREKHPAPVAADLDLFGKKRPVMTVKLPDGTVLRLTTPCKTVSDRFENIGALLDRIANGQTAAEDISELYMLLAVVLSRNLDNTVVPQERLEAIMTADDCVEFFAAYMDFLTREISSKN